MLDRFINPLHAVISVLNHGGEFLGLFALRLFLAWEFWESGMTKLQGENWFAEIRHDFPFPFNLVPAGISWQLSTWFELLGAIALIVGLGTRFISLSLIILTAVAWASVHAGNGYNVCDNGYKMAVIYLIMLLPILLGGPGKLSLDHLLQRRYGRR